MSNNWIKGGLPQPPKFLEDFSNTFTTVVSVITAFLDSIAFILDIIAFLAAFGADPLKAIQAAFINFLTEMIEAIANIGIAFFTYTPHSWDLEKSTGYNGFLKDLEESLLDPGDLARPRLGPDTPFFAFAMLFGANSPFEILKTLQEFVNFLGGLFDKYKNFATTVVPQQPFIGVIEGMDVSVAQVDDKDVLNVAAGKVFMDGSGVQQSLGPVSGIDFFEAGKPHVLVAMYIPVSPSTVDELILLPVAVGTIEWSKKSVSGGPPHAGDPIKYQKRGVSIDFPVMVNLGLEACFLAYFETTPLGKIVNFNGNFRVKIDIKTVEDLLLRRDQTLAESVKPDWVGYNVRHWPLFNDAITFLEQSLRKTVVSTELSSSFSQLSAQLHQISADLHDLAQKVKDTSEAIQHFLEALAEVAFMFITPWPTILSDKDPFRLQAGDQFSLKKGGSPIVEAPLDQTITINASTGSFQGSACDNFTIDLDAKFFMDVYRRRAVVNPGGTIDATVGLTGGAQVSQGVFEGIDARKFRVPTAGAAVKVSTFGTGIEIQTTPNNAANMMNYFSPLTADESIQSANANRFHFPSGASLTLSAWTSNISVTSAPNSIFPVIGWSTTTFSGGVITGQDARVFNIALGTQALVSTKTYFRDYPVSDLVGMFGLTGYTRTGLTDVGNDARDWNIISYGGYRFNLEIKELSVTGGLARQKLGLLATTAFMGVVDGTGSFNFTFPADTLTLSTKSCVIANLSGEVVNLAQWGFISYAKSSFVGTDARLFSWAVNSGFHIKVSNLSGIIFTGDVKLFTAGVSRNGTTLANQITFALRHMLGNRNLEICSYDVSTGLFHIFLGVDVTSVELAPSSTYPALTILGLTGYSAVTYTPTLGIIDGVEPTNLIATVGDFKIKLGLANYNLTVPVGNYTGTALAAAIQTSVRTATSKLETVSYNQTTGRFSFNIDPVGYDWITALPIVIPLSNQITTTALLAILNANFPYLNGNGTEAFIFDNDVFSFKTDGLIEITLSATGSTLTTLGLSAGTFSAVDQYDGSETAPFRFNTSEGVLNISKNRLPFVITFTENTPLTFTQIKNAIETAHPTITVTYPDHKIHMVQSANRALVTDYLMSFAPGVYSPSFVLADLKTNLDTALTDSLAAVTLVGGKIHIYYPDLARMEFNLPLLGDDFRDIFGQADTDCEENYTGVQPKNFAIDTVGLELIIRLGAFPHSILFNTIGYFTGDEMATEVSTQLGLLVTNPPEFTYDLTTGKFSVVLAEDGYNQIVSQTLAISADPVLREGSYVADAVQTSLRSFGASLGTETVLYIGNTFIISDPLLASMELQSVIGQKSLWKLMGLIEGDNTVSANRIIGVEPQFYLLTSNYTSFNIVTPSSSLPITVPVSTDYESGAELAVRIENAVQTATSNSELVQYDPDNGVFSLTSDPMGALAIDTLTISLSGESWYISFAELADRINSSIQIQVPGTSLRIVHSSDTYHWEMLSLTRIDLAYGLTGVDLVTMLGFPAGSSGIIVDEYTGGAPLNFVIQSDNNTFKVILGNHLLVASLPVSSTLYDGSTYAGIVQGLLQTLSGRNTVFEYNTSNSTFNFAIDPNGERLIDNETISFTSGAYTGFALLATLNTINTLSGSVGTEVFAFSQIDNQFSFIESSNKTRSIKFSDPAPVFDMQPALGFAVDNQLTDGFVLSAVCSYFIVVTGENDRIKMNFNLEDADELVTPGVYTGEGMAAELKTKLSVDTTHVETVDYDPDTGKFTFTSNPEGKKESHVSYSTPFWFGNGAYVAAQLQLMFRAVSPDMTEMVTFTNSVFTFSKPDLLKLRFESILGSSMPQILKVLGLTEDIDYMADSLETVKFDEPAPFTITALRNQFGIRIDGLDLLQVAVDPVSDPLTGSEVATKVQTQIQSRLISLSLSDIFYTYSVGGLIVIGNSSYVSSAVSRTNLDAIIESATDFIFSNNDQNVQNQLSASTQGNVNIPFPAFQAAFDQVTSWGSGLHSIWDNIGNTQQKNGYKQLIEAAMKLFFQNMPYYVPEADMNTPLLFVMKNALVSAALAKGRPLSTNLRDMTAQQIVTSVTTLLTNKYFWDAKVEYITADSAFKISSPTKGINSTVEVGIGAVNDVVVYLGLDTGTEIFGTGNVGFVHLVSALEISNLINAAGFVAFPWGFSALRVGRTQQGVLKSPDIFYPHRHYTRDEMPHGAEVQVFLFSLNFGPNSTLEFKNITGTPAVELGFPVGVTPGLVGSAGFVGAFRQAGLPSELDETAFIFSLIGCITLAGPSVFQANYNKLATLLGLPKWV